MNKFGLSLVSGPASEPVTLAQAKAHLRVDFTEEDDLIAALITVAREIVENILNRSIYTQTWKLTLDSFPYPTSFETIAPDERNPYQYILKKFAIYVPQGGVTAIDSIQYLSPSGMRTVDSSLYRVDTNAKPCRIMPIDGFTWPVVEYTAPGCVEVTFTAGSYDDTTCPQSIRHAMLLLIGHLYASREAVTSENLVTVPFAVDALLSPYKVIASC